MVVRPSTSYTNGIKKLDHIVTTSQASAPQRQACSAFANRDETLQVQHAPALALRAIAMHFVLMLMQAANASQVEHEAMAVPGWLTSRASVENLTQAP
jgi:hypothetical protein